MENEIVKLLESVHPFPAKYTVGMIEPFILKYSKYGDVVLDPFVGCGTTLLASSMHGRIGVGSDINPIAYLVSKYKIAYLGSDEISKLIVFCNFIESERIKQTAILAKNEWVNFSGIEHWFEPEAIEALSYLRKMINSHFKNAQKLIDICFVAFSSIIVSVSNQESDTRYAAISKKNITLDMIISLYIRKLTTLIGILKSESRNIEVLDKSSVLLINSKSLNKHFRGKADFLVTSPPYPNTYDYYLYHKHRMSWLGYDYKPVMNAEIGSRREFSSLKRPAENFENDLLDVFTACNAVLKEGAHIMIIIGDGKIRGDFYDSLEMTLRIGEVLQWKQVGNEHTLLDKTSRSFSQSFRTKGKKEHYILFKKLS